MGGRKDSMLKVENTSVIGWETAIRGMRNPMNSWDKSDSTWDWVEDPSPINPNDPGMCLIVGPNDYKLMMNLCKGGTEESKWRRMIHVSCDITAPLYWWKEYDTYKIGTVANSCSTMHKIAEREFTLDDFSWEHLIGRSTTLDSSFPSIPAVKISNEEDTNMSLCITPADSLNIIVQLINQCREMFLATKDKAYWWQMIQLLPSSYNQRRTVDLNYEVLAAQYRQRKNHKLDEWHTYCDWIKTLPYAEFITGEKYV
jgi:hypothetical protein